MSQRDLQAKTQTSLTVHRQPTDGREEEEESPVQRVQRQYGNRAFGQALARTGDGESEVAPEVEAAIQRARGSGQTLDSNVRAQMEPAFGADFGGVRVHTDVEADTLNRAVSARAFTTGQDIFFREGEYQPESSGGRELLAHELTHVVQQTGRVQPKLIISQPSDRYEQEAESTAQLLATTRFEYQEIPKPRLQRANEPTPALYVSYSVPLIPQTSNMSCWAASAAMLVSWRDNLSIDDRVIASGIGYWTEYIHGLLPTDIHMFMSWGLTEEEPQTFTVEAFADLLRSYGPLWVAADANSAAGVAPHIRVVTGIYGDGTPDGTYLAINDPAGPQTVVESYTTYIGSQEQLAETELPVFQRPIYVAHCR